MLLSRPHLSRRCSWQECDLRFRATKREQSCRVVHGVFPLEKIPQLIHLDSTGSKTWFLDSCGRTDHLHQRLLLTNYDLGIAVPAQEIQLGLDFAQRSPELFAGTDMGEDAIGVLNKTIPLWAAIRADVAAELPHPRETAKWAARLASSSPQLSGRTGQCPG